MGVERWACLLVGVDAAPHAGRLRAAGVDTDGRDPEALVEAIEARRPFGLSAALAGPSGEPGAKRVLLGVEVARISLRAGEDEARVGPEALEDALARARDGLRRLGVPGEPMLFLAWGEE